MSVAGIDGAMQKKITFKEFRTNLVSGGVNISPWRNRIG